MDFLALDDWGLSPLNTTWGRGILEVVEDRCLNRSTVIAGQLPLERWHTAIGDPEGYVTAEVNSDLSAEARSKRGYLRDYRPAVFLDPGFYRQRTSRWGTSTGQVSSCGCIKRPEEIRLLGVRR